MRLIVYIRLTNEDTNELINIHQQAKKLIKVMNQNKGQMGIVSHQHPVTSQLLQCFSSS